MRTNEERIAALHARAAELEKEKSEQRVRILQAVSATVCFAAVIVLAFLMPGFSENFAGGSPQNGMSASMLSGSRALGYIVIGIVAFMLCVSVSIFCFRLKKWQDDKDQQSEPNEGPGCKTEECRNASDEWNEGTSEEDV